MGTGNRFRLLFGQTSPQESRTNQTAKYVHTMYIALKGVPKVKQEKVELSQKVGAHTVTFNVSTGAADDMCAAGCGICRQREMGRHG